MRQAAEEQLDSGLAEKIGAIVPKWREPARCQRRLLLAEDDVETRRLLGAALRRQGFDFQAAVRTAIAPH